MVNVIYKNTFIQETTGFEITVWTRPGESAFAALYTALRQQGLGLDANWRIVPTQARRLVDRVA
jgi:hypothetical protein